MRQVLPQRIVQLQSVTIVIANPIVAGNDTLPRTGGNVLANDTVNGQVATAANTNVTPATNGPLSIDADGNVTVAPNTPSGTYTLTYEICEAGATPANCTTATVTIVIANPIVAGNDTLPRTGGNVLANDTVNGQVATAANTNVTPATNGPLSIDADGNVTVAPNTPSGTYTLTYEICEAGATPANCTTATVTIVIANPIVAGNDTLPRTGGNVLANDTVNGQVATAANTNVTPATNGPLSIDADGNVTVAPNTPSGTYTLTYEICEAGATPANCTTATVTIVIANPIVAGNDTLPRTGGNVLANDTVNGQVATAANTNVTPATNGPLSIDADGNVTVAPNTPSGTYTLTYEICEAGATPANCTTATVTIVIANPIVAGNDTLPRTGGNVLANDTVNGQVATAANTNVTPATNGPLSIDADGNVTVAPNTPSGTYTLTYEICEAGATPANCTTATVTIVIANPIVAGNDTLPRTGGNVLANDTVNGQVATAANTNVTPATNGPLSIDADGNVTVAPNTPSGTYTLTYEICEAGATPANCTTATLR